MENLRISIPIRVTMDYITNKKILIITGSRGCGKTTMLISLIDKRKKQGVRVGGIVTKSEQRSRYELKERYYAVDLLHQESRLLLATDPDELSSVPKRAGRFYTDPSAFMWAAERIEQAMAESEILVIDELGPLEVSGGGYLSVAKKIVKRYKGQVVFVIRLSLVDILVELLEIDRNDLEIKSAEDAMN